MTSQFVRVLNKNKQSQEDEEDEDEKSELYFE